MPLEMDGRDSMSSLSEDGEFEMREASELSSGSIVKSGGEAGWVATGLGIQTAKGVNMDVSVGGCGKRGEVPGGGSNGDDAGWE